MPDFVWDISRPFKQLLSAAKFEMDGAFLCIQLHKLNMCPVRTRKGLEVVMAVNSDLDMIVYTADHKNTAPVCVHGCV